MKLRLIFFVTLYSTISGLLFWRNSLRYPMKSIIWRATKSTVELILILFTAMRLPVILISWCCLWFTRPIETPWLKVTVGVLIGTILSLCSMFALEILLLISVFSMDEITGDQEGFLKNLNKARKESQAA
jgi:hypothetical protein